MAALLPTMDGYRVALTWFGPPLGSGGCVSGTDYAQRCTLNLPVETVVILAHVSHVWSPSGLVPSVKGTEYNGPPHPYSLLLGSYKAIYYKPPYKMFSPTCRRCLTSSYEVPGFPHPRQSNHDTRLSTCQFHFFEGNRLDPSP